MAINRMQAALAAATNELTVAALNINFDFTLMKCKAPKEYQNLGNVLSRKKKAEAETGTAHTTAMRLGALFDGVCPPTPNLIKAYGVRVSEIAESATKQETSNGGIFSDYTGVDGTSIWASATSSSAALQVQLLACLLARVWKPSFATSIWFELVKERRQEIAEKYESGEDVAFGSMSAAAKSEISRENLADWDASARAWLQMADRAKEREQKKLRLIIDNVDTAVSKDNNVLSSVLEVWKAAVTTMESLLNGMPQAVESGPVLLALSSWYIYPDILVASGGIKEVNFEDNIIPSGAKFTIGLSPSSSGGESRGVYWSLSLKHLQHYGHPVQSKALLDQDVSKITFLEFSQAVFGTLMGNWDIQGDDVLVACTVFMSFHKAFEKAAATCDEASPQLQMEALAFLRDKSQWWNILVSAAAAILDSSDVLARKLVRLGLRRAPQFLPTRDLPFFGLLDSAYIIRYLKSPEDRIIFLRRMANAAPTDAMASQRPLLIRYYPSTTEQSQFRHLATAVPVPKPPYRRETKTIDGSLEIEYEHERWVHLGYKCEFTDEKAIFLEQDPVTFEAVDERGRKVLHLSSITGISGTYAKVSGVKRVAEIYQNENVPAVPIRKPVMEDMLWILEQDMFEAGAVIEHLKNLSLDFPVNQTVTALGIASKIYQAVPTASVSVEVLNKPLYHTNWFRPSTNPPKPKTFQYKAARSSEIFIPRHIAFSCVAYFGCSADIEPDLLGNVFAMAYEESLYIASELTCDPCEHVEQYELQRVLGNVGRAGITMLVPPSDPILRQIDPASWKVINNHPFDGKQEDCFGKTSMHLTFTDYYVPLYQVRERYTDHNVHFLESIVSIYDSGSWIGDVDILKALSNPCVTTVSKKCNCTQEDHRIFKSKMISVESWEEMLDPPPEPFVVRSSRNWVGRLAALALLSQNLKRSTNQNIAICKERICWNCYFLPRNPGSEVSGSTTLERDSSNISIVHPTKGAAAKPTAASLSRREKLGYIRAFVY